MFLSSLLQFDVLNIDKLMNYPQISIDLDSQPEVLRKQLEEEYERFKEVQLTGDQMSRYVAMILKEPSTKIPANKEWNQIRETPTTAPSVAVPSMPKEMEDELIQRIRSNECSGMFL